MPAWPERKPPPVESRGRPRTRKPGQPLGGKEALPREPEGTKGPKRLSHSHTRAHSHAHTCAPPQNGTPHLSLKAGQPALQKLPLPGSFHSTGSISPTWPRLSGPGTETLGPRGHPRQSPGTARARAAAVFRSIPDQPSPEPVGTPGTEGARTGSRPGHTPRHDLPHQQQAHPGTGAPSEGPGRDGSFHAPTPMLFTFCRLLCPRTRAWSALKPRTPRLRLGKLRFTPQTAGGAPGPGEAPDPQPLHSRGTQLGSRAWSTPTPRQCREGRAGSETHRAFAAV